MAFLALAAGINLLGGVSAFGYTADSSTIYSAYLVLGILAGTLLAVGLAIERSVAAVQRHLNDLTNRLVQALTAEVARDSNITVQELAGRLEPALAEIRRRTAGVRRFTPGGALARMLARRLAPELVALADLSGAVSLSPSASPADTISAHAAAAAGAPLVRQARVGLILAAAIWVLLFAISAAPLLLLRHAS